MDINLAFRLLPVRPCPAGSREGRIGFIAPHQGPEMLVVGEWIASID